MADDRFPLQHRSETDVDEDVHVHVHSLCAYLDDHHQLARHMEQRDLIKAGATMGVKSDALKGQVVGSVIPVTGRVLDVELVVDEVVTERVPRAVSTSLRTRFPSPRCSLERTPICSAPKTLKEMA